MLTDLDQPVRIRPEDRKIFDDVDEVIGRALITGDPQLVADYANELRREGSLRGLALAKMIYKLEVSWELFNIEGTVEEYIYERMGIAPQTTNKYNRMWAALFENTEIKEEVKFMLMGRPIKDLLLLTAAAREGSMDNDALREAAEAPDTLGVREKVREARGTATSSSTAIYIYIVTGASPSKYPVGTIVARYKDAEMTIGTLDVESPLEPVQRAVARIVNAAGIQEK